MARPRILIVTPYAAQANNGNWRTAARWAHFLRERCRVIVQAQPAGDALADADCLIALHARRSHAAVLAWRERFGERPLAVVLTGTDLYRDLPAGDAAALASLALADRLVVLQAAGLRALPKSVRGKSTVVHQSAAVLKPASKACGRIDCVMAGHLREEKDPLTALRAWQYLPPQAPIRLLHVGRALDPTLAAAARACERAEPRYRWVGEKGHAWTRQVIRRAHLLLLPSRMEGGANVVVEAITAGTPVLASRVAGNVGMLGAGYAGYFGVGDAAALARLLLRCQRDDDFLRRLDAQCRERRGLFLPRREQAAVRALVRGLLQAQPGRIGPASPGDRR
jgi:putative glycosyltransferase (TIGR04348 family)